ncbi:MFS transporter [Blastococcus sp. TML/M2B]|nr:MFS transporter [Blastococcus sp. TML/M2B]MBN1092845.1 MFS transporter [Blastococcus sp. TML/M2B]
MLLLSPGLALFLFGVSSIAEGGEGASFGPRVWVSATIGVLLILAFVRHALGTDKPLIDLRLFRNRRLTIATVAMFVFVIAFMGAGLLFPSYFLQVRGETTLMAGLLIAPQGLGAMVTMPIAGVLADKVPIGRTVPFALLVMAAGFFVFTQVGADTPYPVLCGALFVMGLGMGGTMMPIMTSALKSLTNAEVARGSTLMNIVQQIGGSIGTAVLSVVLTNQLQSRLPGAEDPLEAMAAGFGTTFTVAFVLVLVALVPVAFLPRKKEESHLLDDEDGAVAAPVLMH